MNKETKEIITKNLLKKITDSSGVIFPSYEYKKMIEFDTEHTLKEIQTNKIKEFYDKWLDDPNISEASKIQIISMMGKGTKELKNIYKIVKKTLPNINEKSIPEKIDEDWMSLFIDKAKNITTEQMQYIWSKVLAEATLDNNICTKTLLHSLFLMTDEDAKDFQNLCRFCFHKYRPHGYYNTNEIDSFLIIFYSKNIRSYHNSNINREKLSRLERFGLIDVNFSNEFSLNSSIFPLRIGNNLIQYNGDKNVGAGNVIFTYDGYLLYQVIEKIIGTNRNSIANFTYETWRNRGYDMKISRL